MKYLLTVNRQLYAYSNIVLYLSDAFSEFIFCCCLQQSLFVTALCDDHATAYRLWGYALGTIPVISPAQLEQLEEVAVILSPEKYAALEDAGQLLAQAAYYFYDPSFAPERLGRRDSLLALHPDARKKPLLLFDCNGEGMAQQEFLHAAGIPPAACATFQESLWGTASSLPVIRPSELPEYTGNANVLVATRAWDAVFPTLENAGYDPDDVFLDVVRMVNARSCVLKPWMHGKNKRLIEDPLYKIIEMNRLGGQIVQELQRRADTAYLITGPGIGDAGIVASYCHAFKAQHGYRRIGIVCYERVQEVPTLFSAVDEVVGLGSTEFWALINYFFVSRNYDQGNIHFAYCRYQNCYSEEDAAGSFRRRNKPWFFAIKEDMLLLPAAAAPQQLSLPSQCEAAFSGRIDCGSAVLFIPSSTTQEQYLSKPALLRKQRFFAILADRLKAAGIRVYVNAHSGLQLPGVEPLTSRLTELLCASTTLRGIVSVRCGLQEVLCLADCHLSILYEDAYSYTHENCEDWVMRERMYSYLLAAHSLEQTAAEIAAQLVSG